MPDLSVTSTEREGMVYTMKIYKIFFKLPKKIIFKKIHNFGPSK